MASTDRTKPNAGKIFSGNSEPGTTGPAPTKDYVSAVMNREAVQSVENQMAGPHKKFIRNDPGNRGDERMTKEPPTPNSRWS